MIWRSPIWGTLHMFGGSNNRTPFGHRGLTNAFLLQCFVFSESGNEHVIKETYPKFTKHPMDCDYPQSIAEYNLPTHHRSKGSMRDPHKDCLDKQTSGTDMSSSLCLAMDGSDTLQWIHGSTLALLGVARFISTRKCWCSVSMLIYQRVYEYETM